ncbi:hypothetical protein MKY30_15650 [Oceanobacillus sp. FSL W8-0428]|uniref:Uncharacterized protein n=1 Tax=Oceanobacillus sojae TaxID=582851 RepID=A0A511ZEI4_9BACI|nr:hypothetical protein [Oceanobacillus sojae]GEN85858.1 hypothetical protein OSO01_05970 [Oceanobacillus sojae]
MKFEFYPQVRRLLENNEEELEMHYLSYSWNTPTIKIRPPYYSDPVYEPFYPDID